MPNWFVDYSKTLRLQINIYLLHQRRFAHSLARCERERGFTHLHARFERERIIKLIEYLNYSFLKEKSILFYLF
jgi:hypothetical protein